MPTSIRPGDVLAGRYRLDDLLSESRGARFWRAFDQVLARPVAVHVIPAQDDRAATLLDAARRSVVVKDRRFLRVLDADETDDICFVVNEWGQGRSLDILLAGDGPLDPAQAAWIVRETAAALAVAHDADVTHSRLVPENVLLDHQGAVRVIGLAVDAALNGLPVATKETDVEDLVGCLYAAMTGRWAGPSVSVVPAAHRENGRVLRPRRVRGGIPRPLDELCAEVLCPPQSGAHARAAFDLTTARGVADFLRSVAGQQTDLSGLAPAVGPQRETRPAAAADSSYGGPMRPLTQTQAVAGGASATEPIVAADPGLDRDPREAPDEVVTEVAAVPVVDDTLTEPGRPMPIAEQPTQAGMPVFEDDGEVGWIARRSVPPAPPEPPEAPVAKPLFAPEPPPGTPARRPRVPSTEGTGTWTNTGTGASAATGTGTGTGSREFWPWDTTGSATGSGAFTVEEEADAVPGRRWFRLAVLVAVAALVLLIAMVLLNLSRGRTPLGSDPAPSSSSPAATSASPLSGLTVSDLDPQGSPPEENPELAPLAVDGDKATTWHTETYRQQLGPAGLKTGVGLVVDIGTNRRVAAVDVTFVGQPTGFSVYLTDQQPTGIAALTPVAQERATATSASVTLPDDAAGRYVVIWLTELPAVRGGFRGEIAEVVVRG
ncbi:MAG: protein kinase family protein [Nocardioidaceae bacterium]